MKTLSTFLGLLTAVALAWPMESATAQTHVNSNSKRTTRASATEGIAVSIRSLRGATNTPEAKSLFGATRLLGFLLADDELGSDCILVLEKEPRRPILKLDDFAVAHRNIVDGNARPACTIDPRAEILKKLADITQRIRSQQDERSIQRCLRECESGNGSEKGLRMCKSSTSILKPILAT